jgi:hypothetical protein
MTANMHWRKVLDGSQLELTGVICDLIIPETETPGARSAGVPDYIDFTLSRASEGTRRRFIEGLEWIVRESQRRFGRTFMELAPEQQIAFLRSIEEPAQGGGNQAGAAFFRDIKNRTIYAYYTSQAGLFQELGYKRDAPPGDFTGCNHPEHLRRETR